MLTNNDLKSIGDLIDVRLETKLEEKLETKLKPIKRDIANINSSIAKISRSITKIQKDQTTIVNYFDQEYTGLNTRMRRVENYLHLPVIQ